MHPRNVVHAPYDCLRPKLRTTLQMVLLLRTINPGKTGVD
jgi:hypothetical protein